MKQLFIYITLSIVLGSTFGLQLPAPENSELQDRNIETDSTDFDNNDINLHEIERRAVARGI